MRERQLFIEGVYSQHNCGKRCNANLIVITCITHKCRHVSISRVRPTQQLRQPNANIDLNTSRNAQIRTNTLRKARY